MPKWKMRAGFSAGRRALLTALPSGLLLTGASWLPASAQPRPAQRPKVVSVGAGVTEIVYALQAQSQLLAVDTSSLYPQAALALPKVGYQRTLSAEGVLGMGPQVLLAGQEAGPPAVLRQIESAGVKVVPVQGDYTFEGVIERIRIVAEALGRQAEGQALTAALTARWQALQARMAAAPLRGPGGQPLRVACLMRHGASTMAAGRDTGADAMLRLIGAVNVFGNDFSNYKPLSAESLAHAAPDAVVGTFDGTQEADARSRLLATPGLAMTPAGQAQRAVLFDIVLLLGFGPRLPQAVEDLYSALRT
ncbi:Hemin-binding periplasmic protein HmuT precursor [Pigmentiphaga humi]|uniref:Hemin-binding periplasmic protein HmuT n=1 Tax=Pigmentiphaga humi TaxID=2478468 RepID=A0A3P4BBV3_9BURK|nr:ABC transporter substrate-binding protein [Pigmentiphaga humi]VCU72595.1 Hemin-binding periplasmic protein HmuT precursor [Pigmentiphaga humi]